MHTKEAVNYLPVIKGGLGVLGKNLPLGLGTLISLASAGSRAISGDYLGAGLDLGSAAISPIPFIGSAAGLGLSGINLARDLQTEYLANKKRRFNEPENLEDPRNRLAQLREENRMEQQKLNSKYAAASSLQSDITNPEEGTQSDLYKAIMPTILPADEKSISSQELKRINALKEDVRKGMLGMEYLTGIRKTKGESFYDKHPAEAIATNIAANAPALGAGVAGAGLLENFRRQWSNMRKTEPAKMSRSENPLDATNPSNLLHGEGKGGTRADISRIFGDLGDNAEKRLSILDQLSGKTLGQDSLSKEYKSLMHSKKDVLDSHNKTIADLTGKLHEATTGNNPEQAKNIQKLISAHTGAHEHETSKLESELKQLLQKAKKHESSAALEKYVNLHESLRRAKETGGLKGYLGEGVGAFGGIGDLLEKYHITKAHPGFNAELIKEIAHEYGGAQAGSKDWQNFLGKTLQNAADVDFQSSGLRKALSRAKLPLMAGTATALGGMGLYQLLKSIQNQTYSPEQQKEWKKTILRSRGDFDAADRVDSEESTR